MLRIVQFIKLENQTQFFTPISITVLVQIEPHQNFLTFNNNQSRKLSSYKIWYLAIGESISFSYEQNKGTSYRVD